MKYFTTKELKNEYRDEAKRTLSSCIAKNVRYNLARDLLIKYAKKLSFSKEANILDLGAASGYFLKQLSEMGYKNLYGHDIDDYLPEEVKKEIKEFKIAELNTEKLPWPDNFFDAITGWCVLPHLENPFFAAREVARTLKPGGLFIFTAPHIASRPSIDFFSKKKYFAGYRETNNHISFLPMSIVKKAFLKDFDLLDIDFLIVPKIFDGWKGKIRKTIYNLSIFRPKWRKFLKDRWGYNIVYILTKKAT